jgi:hypothetical protein
MGAEPARRGTPAPPEEVAEDTEEKDKRIETSRGERENISFRPTRRRELVDHRYLHLLMHHIPTLIMTAILPPLSGHSALSGHQWEQLELENALHGRRIWSRTTRRRNVAIPDLLRMREMFDRENVSEASSDEPLRVVLRGDGRRQSRASLFPYIHPARYAPDLLHLEMHMMMGELPCAWCAAQPAAEQD